MELKEWHDKISWNKFVLGNSSPASFQQSWQWGEFKESLGETVSRFVICHPGGGSGSTIGSHDERKQKDSIGPTRSGLQNDNILATVQVIERALPAGKSYLEISRPVISEQGTPLRQGFGGQAVSSDQFFKKLLIKLEDLSKKNIFIRISPVAGEANELREMGFRTPKILTKLKPPDKTLLLDLSKSEDEILKAMHQKTRYNIRLAERRGVRVESYSPPLDTRGGRGSLKREKRQTVNPSHPPLVSRGGELESFWQLMEETGQRQEIGLHPKKYYQVLLDLSGDLSAKLYLATYQDKPLAGAIVIYFGDTATYLHGASSREEARVMAPYLLHWNIIREAKDAGFKWYDWWGVAPATTPNREQLTSNNKSYQLPRLQSALPQANGGQAVTSYQSSWSGITRFKRGFVGAETGREVNYPGMFDFIISSFWYRLFELGKLFRG